MIDARKMAFDAAGRRIVNDISLTLEKGEIVGVLGPNGSGKTTTFHLIAGRIPLAEGEVWFDGRDVSKLPLHRRARMGLAFVAQSGTLFPEMTVTEHVLASLELQGIARAERSTKCQQLLEELGIAELRNSQVQTLSGGERRRLELARALTGDPDYLMLDEPFAGVDPVSVHRVIALIESMRERGLGVLVTDHNVVETLRMCDRGYVLLNGAMLTAGTPDDIRNHSLVQARYLGQQPATEDTHG